jgi:hypothetical protein
VEVFPKGGEEGGVRSGMGSSFTPRVMLEAGGACLRPEGHGCGSRVVFED